MSITLKLKIREWLFKTATPFVKWMGKIRAPFVKTQKALSDTIKILETLSPLDIILSESVGHMSNLFNPGKWKHAIVYIGKENNVPMIIEAIGQGVTKRNLYQCLADKDAIAICRIKQPLTQEGIDRAVEFCNSEVGKPYDYEFNMTTNTKYQNFFCSELAYATLKVAVPDMTFTLMKTLGVDTIIPGDFYNAKGKFDVVFETKEETEE